MNTLEHSTDKKTGIGVSNIKKIATPVYATIIIGILSGCGMNPKNYKDYYNVLDHVDPNDQPSLPVVQQSMEAPETNSIGQLIEFIENYIPDCALSIALEANDGKYLLDSDVDRAEEKCGELAAMRYRVDNEKGTFSEKYILWRDEPKGMQ